MFDLNEQIKKWRDSLVKQQVLKESDIDELENHLREEIDEMSTTKLLPEEMFVIAVNRLGHIDNLVGEYAKINSEKRSESKFISVVWGLFYYLVTLYYAKRIVVYCIQIAVNNRVFDYQTLALIGFVSELLAVLVLLLCGWVFYRRLKRISFIERHIEKMSAKLTLLASLFVLIIFRIGFHIPIHAFRGMNFQPELELTLRIMKLIILISIPVIFILVTGLKRSYTKAT